MNKLIFTIISIFLISSCHNDVFFDNPQPQSSKELIDIPKNLIGDWISDGMQSKKELYISNDHIKFDDNKYTLDSNLILLKNMHGLFVNLKNDTLGWNCYNIKYNDSLLTVYSIIGIDMERPPNQFNGEIVKGAEKSFYDMAKYEYTFIDSNNILIHNIDLINLHRIFNYENTASFKRK
ncbi:MAG: hypothetical protein CMD04_05255 [Flavobacteriales bacterium]|nr:hypothetical protein [Flavobacteriales bacterium]